MADRPRHAADEALDLVRGRPACPVTGRVHAAAAVERISRHSGYVLYMRQEGRGIGLYDKLDTSALQDRGLDAYLATKARRGGHDLLSRGPPRAAEPPRHARPAHLRIPDR